MLNRSFIFAPGMTEDLERALWGRGVLTWEVLRRHPGEVAAAIGEQRAKKLQGAVGELTDLIQRRDLAAFNRIWPEKESWRLWEGWCASDEVALVDIETTGLTPGFDQITLIGLSRGGHEQVFVADRALGEDKPLDTFPDAMKGVRLLVTFNGRIVPKKTDEITRRYNHDRYNPRDGELIEATDRLAAFVEVYLALRNGITSPELVSARDNIRSRYGKQMIGGIDFGQIYADLEG